MNWSKNSFAILAALVLSGACSDSLPIGTDPAPLAQSLPRAADSVGDGPYQFSFWIKPEFYGTEIAERGEGHPCGGIQTMPVDEISQFPPDAPYATARAFEYNASGEPIREWSLPVDFVIVGLDGDSVAIDVSSGEHPITTFWIDLGGRIGRSPDPIELQRSGANMRQCPAAVDSDLYGCIAMQDSGSRRVHNLAVEFVCT